jgi:bifunctional non-homologous end joining protein LigD
MVSRKNTSRRSSGFVEPCGPSKAARPPPGPLWVHEIKHFGFRLMVRRELSRVRCYTKGGYDWVDRFPAIVEAASRLKASSFLIDGEAVICRDDGLSDFNALRSRPREHDAILFAFDLIEHEGDDLRDVPLIERKQRPAKLLGKASHAIQPMPA